MKQKNKTNKLSALFFLAICALWNACNPVADNPKTTAEAHLNKIAYTSTIDSLQHHYYLYLPKGYDSSSNKKWPVLLFLHGNGERGNGNTDLEYVLTHGPLYEAWIQKKDLPFILVAPQLPLFGMDYEGSYLRNRDRNSIPKRLKQGTPARQAYFNTPNRLDGSPSASNFPYATALPPNGWERCTQDLMSMLSTVQNNFQADSTRLYLTGLSYGGFGTWYLASKFPKKFAAISPVVAWGHPDLMLPIALEKIPVWVFAGGRDTTIPVQYFYPGLNKLEEYGHQSVRFTNHEDLNHDAWKRVYRSEDFYQWLLRHKKSQ